MKEQEYKVIISETYKERGRRPHALYNEKEKREKKERAKWLNLLLKINKIKEEK